MQGPEQELFPVLPDSFFSLLARKNKSIYFRALMVLRTCYQGELRFQRPVLVTYLIHHMMNDLIDLVEEDADPVEVPNAEESTLSGRAHALVRRFVETGWLKSVLDYATAVLDVLHSSGCVQPLVRFGLWRHSDWAGLAANGVADDDALADGALLVGR